MNTNGWIIVERDRMLSWRDWYLWARGDRMDPEPDISQWEQGAVRKLAHMDYIYRRFLRPTILTKVWIMLSLYGVTPQQIQSGYSQLGDAATGGDFGLMGYWEWNRGSRFSSYVDLGVPWRPVQVLRFMPPTVAEDDTEIPATEVRDVNLLLGQPPREFPA